MDSQSIQYKGYFIKPSTNPMLSMGDSEFIFVHSEYDGPEDYRIGVGDSVRDCMNQIDDQIYEHGDMELDAPMESVNRQAMSLLAEADLDAFVSVIGKYGLRSEGFVPNQDLGVTVQEGQVVSISSLIADDVDDRVELSADQRFLKHLAESKGLMVVVTN